MFPRQQILESFKLKAFADNNSKFDENGRKFFKIGKKTLLEKEKLLVMSNLSFSHCVSKDLYCRHIKTRACLGKG